MLGEALIEPDSSKRLEMYSDIERYILDQALAIPVFDSISNTYILLQPWVRGFDVPRYGGSIFKNVWFEDPPRRAGN